MKTAKTAMLLSTLLFLGLSSTVFSQDTTKNKEQLSYQILEEQIYMYDSNQKDGVNHPKLVTFPFGKIYPKEIFAYCTDFFNTFDFANSKITIYNGNISENGIASLKIDDFNNSLLSSFPNTISVTPNAVKYGVLKFVVKKNILEYINDNYYNLITRYQSDFIEPQNWNRETYQEIIYLSEDCMLNGYFENLHTNDWNGWKFTDRYYFRNIKLIKGFNSIYISRMGGKDTGEKSSEATLEVKLKPAKDTVFVWLPGA